MKALSGASAPASGQLAPVRIEGRDLACIRGGRLVFERLSFRCGPGETLLLRGPNGAGKSSLIRLIAGLVRPAAGTLAVEGGDAESGRMHLLGHADAIKPAASLREFLRFWARAFGGSPSEAAIVEATERVGLAYALGLPCAVLSAGQRRRLGLARLILTRRPVWLLDEPNAGLDRDGEALLGALMAGHSAAGGAMIVAAHLDLPTRPTRILDFAGAA